MQTGGGPQEQHMICSNCSATDFAFEGASEGGATGSMGVYEKMI